MHKPFMTIRQLLVEREEDKPYLPDATLSMVPMATVNTTTRHAQVTSTWFDAYR